jgi:acyl-CoA reductase-like NAD-dependent aldehyde dehydrogenase
MNIIDNDLLSVQEARIRMEEACEAQKNMASCEQRRLDEIAFAMLRAVNDRAHELAQMAWEETDYGIVDDKYVKIRFICERLADAIRDMRCVGIIERDEGKKLMDVGVPLGVIVAICPATSPIATVVHNAVIAIKSGNAIVFTLHPAAAGCMRKVLELLIESAEAAGLPHGALAYLGHISKSGAVELMRHRHAALIINTSVPTLLQEGYRSGKPFIVGGNGNGPAFIERSADIDQAAADIVRSKCFDYGVVSAAEQSVVVDRCIEGHARAAFEREGAYFMARPEADALGALFYHRDGNINPDMVGVSAQRLAKKAGFMVPDHVKVLVSEEKYVSQDNPYAKEKLCPVLAWYVEDDWMDACEKCIELLIGEKQGHTLVIHSNDETVIRQFALKKPVGRMLVNTPAVFGGMGATSNLFPAMTLGSASAGQGITSDNVSPMNLVYVRKIGYGVRDAETFLREMRRPAEPVHKNRDDLEYLILSVLGSEQ